MPVYPDLSSFVRKTEEEEYVWSTSRIWVNLMRNELPGEEESRIWGTILQDTNGYPLTEPVPCPEPHIVQGDHILNLPVPEEAQEDDECPTEVDSVDLEDNYYSASDDYDDLEVGGGVTLAGSEGHRVEENGATKVTDPTGTEVAVSNHSALKLDTDSAISAADNEDYGDDDDLVSMLQGLDMSSFDSPQSPPSYETYMLNTLPFWAQYEATRIALHYGVPLSNAELSKALLPHIDELKKACQVNDLQRSWHKVMEKFASNYPPSPPQQRMSAALWAVLQRDKWSKTAYMTGSIRFNSSSTLPPFSMKLNTLSYQSSNRFWRKFGSDRFLTVRLPSVPNHLPRETDWDRKQLCKTPSIFNDSVVHFLMQGIELLGRVWKLFYVRDTKDKKNQNEPFQAILFATRGEGIEVKDQLEVEELLNWHIPLVSKNLNSTVPKLWSRISLGLTKTTGTIHFTTDQICPNPHEPRKPGDPYTPDPNIQNVIGDVKGEAMDDGCSFASPAVFRKIQQLLGLKEAPTAVQGRLGGAKGLWIVDPVALKEVSQGARDPDEIWIRVNESQAKYQEHQGSELDPAWTTLDLAMCSHPPKPADVNLQLLAILDHRGVPFGPLRDLVDEHLEAIIQELNNAMDDRVLLRNWVYFNGKLTNSRAAAKIGYQGACPTAPAEKLLMWLDAGFLPQTQAYVNNELTKMIEGFWESLKEKMHIRIPLSTNLFCIADPTGTLKEGEISLQFSRGIEDPRTGRRRDFIEGDILVARNPAHLPSDIQKVRAVYSHELRELKDVIVFSTQGLRSLASLLSGGDYDGDKCWICWDSRIVEPFQKEGPINTAFTNESEWFTKYDARVNRLSLPELPATQLHCGTITQEQARVANAFLRAGALYTLNSETNMLGKYAKLHERYAKRFGLADEFSIELAKICGSLVDAPKQGLTLRPNHMTMRNRKFALKGYTDDPGHKPPHADPNDSSANIIARLDGFAQEKIEACKTEFKKRHHLVFSDSDLTQMIHREDKRAKLDPVIKECLQYLRSELQRIWGKWNSMGNGSGSRRNSERGRPFMQSQSQPQSTEDDTFGNKVEVCYADYFMIKPLPEGHKTDHPVVSRWMEDAEKPNSEWQLLKASAAFFSWGGCYAIVWYLAGQQLCELKARATGGVRYVIEDIYQSLKTDRRFMRKREEDAVSFGAEDEDEGDVWYDFEDGI